MEEPIILQERSLSELQIQAGAWKKIWKDIPELRRCFYHIPNESTYNNGQQKSSGVIAGIQDMHFLCRSVLYLIELKDDKGRLSRAQKVVHSMHHRQGFNTWVFRTVEDQVDFIKAVWYQQDIRPWDKFLSEANDGTKYELFLAEWQKSKKDSKK